MDLEKLFPHCLTNETIGHLNDEINLLTFAKHLPNKQNEIFLAGIKQLRKRGLYRHRQYNRFGKLEYRTLTNE